MTDQQQAPELTAEQQAQQAQMQAAMRQQQEQLQNHINSEIQKGVQHYNLDVQRLTIAAQGLEAVSKVNDHINTLREADSHEVVQTHCERVNFICGEILKGIERSLGINTLSVELPSVSHETTGTGEKSAPVDNIGFGIDSSEVAQGAGNGV
jgi:predicted RNA-binding protein with EMAP domain